MATSIAFCCRLFQTSTRRCFSSSSLLIQHSYTLCCITPQTLYSNTGFRYELFGGQRSGPTKSSVSCCSSLMVSLTRWDAASYCWKTTYRLQRVWSLTSAERVRHGGNTGRCLSFQGRQRSTRSYPFTTAIEALTDFEKDDRVHSKRLGAMSLQ